MTKKALLIASVCCGCCGLAFWGGWSAGALGSAHSEDDRDLRTKIAAVEGELETSRTATERLASERDHIASQLATAEQTKRELLRRVQAMNETARSENAHAVANASHADAAGVLYGVNWPELQALTLEHRGVALAVGDLIAGGSGSRSLSPEMLAARQKIVSALSNAATQLRLEVPYPALDPDVLPRMLDVYFGGLVGLSEEQLDEIKRVAASYQSEFDDDPRTPIIAQRRRERLLTRLGQALEGRLDETQHSDWQRLAPIWEEIRSGRVRRVQLGVADEAKARDRLLHEWRDYYRLEAENRDAATRLATRYVSEARELLANWGQNGAEPRTLTADERARFGHAIADLQDRIDRELLKGLSDVQLDLLQGRYALDIHIDDSARCQVSTAETPGF